MKRVLASILTLFYLALSSSAAINIHYCGGELESVKINAQAKVCCCSDREIPSPCCQDKELNLKLNIDQQASTTNNLRPKEFVLDTLIILGNDILQITESEELVVEDYIIPPPKLEVIWLRNCSLTFYG